jgi:hypothetical protein
MGCGIDFMRRTAKDLADFFLKEERLSFISMHGGKEILRPVSQELTEILKRSENTMDRDADATLPSALFIISIDDAHELLEPSRRGSEEHELEAYDIFRGLVGCLTPLPIAFIALSEHLPGELEVD